MLSVTLIIFFSDEPVYTGTRRPDPFGKVCVRVKPIFQVADAYGGYGKLYEPGRSPGLILEAACWVHARRPFFVMADLAENARRKAQGKKPAVISPLALEVVRRIDQLFEF